MWVFYKKSAKVVTVYTAALVTIQQVTNVECYLCFKSYIGAIIKTTLLLSIYEKLKSSVKKVYLFLHYQK